MLKFKSIEIGDKEWVDEILSSSDCRSLEYNFTTMFIWQKVYNMKVASQDGMLFSSSGKNSTSFLFPVGKGDLEDAVKAIDDYCHSESIPMRFHSLSREQCELLEQIYPGRFRFIEKRDSGDYVYTSESLMSLKGKKLSSKRNHINRFEGNYPNWRYEEMNDSNLQEAMDMHKKWCMESGCEDEPGLLEESCAVRRAFQFFNELKLSGGILRANSEIAAFSMGDPLNQNTFLVHIEKAYTEIQGAYPMINKQFVLHNCQDYEFVNREDDTGDEGLRKAKLSYQPVEIIQKFDAKPNH